MNASISATPARSQRGDHLRGLGRAHGQRLLAQHVLAGGGGAPRPLGVEVVGQRDVHRLDVGVGEQLVVRAVGARDARARRPRRRPARDPASAMATTSQRADRCIAGITLRVAIDAHPSTPQRTGTNALTTPPGASRRRRGRRRPPSRPGPGSTTSPSPSRQRSATSAGSSPAGHGGGLHARAGRDLLVVVRHEHGPPAEVGEHLAVGAGAGAAAERISRPSAGANAASASSPSRSPHTTPSTAARASCSRLTSLRIPASTPVASGRSGVRSPSRYGSSVRPPAPGAAARASSSNASWSTPSSRPHGVGDLRRVERAHEREVASGGVGEPGDDARRIGDRLVADRVHGARRPDRDGHVARAQPDAERPRHVVARARRRPSRPATRRRPRRGRAPPAPRPTSPARRRRWRAGRRGSCPSPPTSSRCRTRRRGR